MQEVAAITAEAHARQPPPPPQWRAPPKPVVRPR
jgi:hypothetical protein